MSQESISPFDPQEQLSINDELQFLLAQLTGEIVDYQRKLGIRLAKYKARNKIKGSTNDVIKFMQQNHPQILEYWIFKLNAFLKNHDDLQLQLKQISIQNKTITIDRTDPRTDPAHPHYALFRLLDELQYSKSIGEETLLLPDYSA